MTELLGVDYWGYRLEVDPLLPEKDKARLRYKFVEKSFLDNGIEINNWYKVRTNPYNDDYVFVEAESRELAVRKYVERINK